MVLDGDEAHHLAHVLRIGPGAQVALFDGSGREAAAVVTAVHRHRVELDVEPAISLSREQAIAVRVAVSLPKGDRQRVLVEKLTEIGVVELIPLVCRRGVAQPTETALARLQKCVVAASRQSGRNVLMRLAEPSDVPSLISSLVPDHGPGESAWYAHPDPALPPLATLVSGTPAIIAVGPEGGFDGTELEAFQASGWQGVGLGPAILRVETAAIVAAAVLTAARTPVA